MRGLARQDCDEPGARHPLTRHSSEEEMCVPSDIVTDGTVEFRLSPTTRSSGRQRARAGLTVRYRSDVDVAISGARGLLGSALAASLRADGHRVMRFARGG